MPPSDNPLMKEYPYALLSQACFIDGLNAGVAGFVTWCLQEVYYPGGAYPMHFGLWDYADGDWKVRPIYHVVAAFSRHTQAGDTVRRCTSTEPDLVKAVCAGGTLFWLNLSETPLEIEVAGLGAATVRVMTADTLEGDRECGTTMPLPSNGRFTAPGASFGYALRPAAAAIGQ